MAKQTLQDALSARRDDPRALRGAISMVGGKPRIVFGVVGQHGRFSVDVDGDDLKLVDDPRADEVEAPAESAEEAQGPTAEVEPSELPEGGEEASAKGNKSKSRGKRGGK